jgi:hypothetical protein
LTASSNWAAGTCVDNGSCETWWASFFTEVEALVLVALTVVLVATTVSIDGFTDEIFITLTCWNGSWWTWWAFWLWAECAAWSTATFINIISSNLMFSFLTLNDLTFLDGAFDNTGGNAAA